MSNTSSSQYPVRHILLPLTATTDASPDDDYLDTIPTLDNVKIFAKGTVTDVSVLKREFTLSGNGYVVRPLSSIVEHG
jgi:hypothetical protein